jgi:chromate transport protein ChrA
VKAIFEEEVLGKEKKKDSSEDSHQTMVRFLGSIIIAISIEALMLVFKFALTDPGKLLYAVYLIVAISVLIIALSVYLKVNQKQK